MEIKEIINKEGNILENFKQVAKIKRYIPLIEKIKLSQRLCEDYMTLQAVIEEKQYFPFDEYDTALYYCILLKKDIFNPSND